MANESVSLVLNNVSRNLNTSSAALAVKIESGVGSGNLVAIDFKSGSVTATHTNFGGTALSARGISFANDGLETITLTVAGMSIPVLANETLEEAFAAFTSITVTVPTSCAYRLILLG